MIEESDHSDESKYFSLQYALYSTTVILLLGGASYLYTASFIIADKNTCTMLTHEQICPEERRWSSNTNSQINLTVATDD